MFTPFPHSPRDWRNESLASVLLLFALFKNDPGVMSPKAVERGSGSCRFYSFLRQRGNPSTRRTLSSRLTMSCVKPPEIERQVRAVTIIFINEGTHHYATDAGRLDEVISVKSLPEG